jgi:hypothetical protein
MGFLDHSTNNIIVDAVLTDVGRQALARNDGSFQIFQFALGDDEVDYNVIKQFGRTVGREKIEKNTPLLEAFTAGSLGVKHKLLSISNEFLTPITLNLRSFSDTTFSTYSVSGGSFIRTFVKVIGLNSGLTKTIEIQIS